VLKAPGGLEERWWLSSQEAKPMGYSLVAGFSRVEMRKHFRTINVQWIGQ
jgi:hypothetical protein